LQAPVGAGGGGHEQLYLPAALVHAGENGSTVIEDWSLNGRTTMVSDWEKRDAVPVVTDAA
jgi:hypothetical protein